MSILLRGQLAAAATAIALLASACARPDTSAARLSAAEAATLPWDSIVTRARGTTVTWRMWRGDPSINAFVDRWAAPRLRERYGITLRAVEGQGAELVNQLLVERDAGARGTTDLVWINGETFAQLRRADLLFGPWASRLPAASALDSSSSIILRDFQQPLDGFESPWGRVQFALIYDTVRTPSPPRTLAALAEWIRAHPGRFTHDQGFSGITFLKTALYALHGGHESLAGPFDSTRYATASDSLFRWLERLAPSFWRGGTAYPAGVAELHRLFANGDVDFSMSNNQHDVVTKVRQGILPPTARALLLHDGTIANAHYLGIPADAPNPAAAMVVANFLLSAEAQAEKRKPEVWADGTVLDPTRLTPGDATFFRAVAPDARELSSDSLTKYARPEIAPEWHERLAADWQARIRRRTP